MARWRSKPVTDDNYVQLKKPWLQTSSANGVHSSETNNFQSQTRLPLSSHIYMGKAGESFHQQIMTEKLLISISMLNSC